MRLSESFLKKEMTAYHLVPRMGAGLPCAARNNRALRNSLTLKQSSRCSGYFSAAQPREMALKN